MSESVPALIVPSLEGEIALRLEQHRHAARGALAPETERALAKTSAAWTSWASSRGVRHLPAEVETVVAYVDELAEAGKRPASIRQAVWGIAYMHRAAGLPDPTKGEPVRLALKRMTRNLGARPRQAAPIGENEVQRILATAGKTAADKRNLALVLVMRDLLARRSEAVALEVGNIEPAEDGSATVLIARSKTDQAGEGEVRWLSPRAHKAVQDWLAVSGITDGPIFRAVNKGGRVGEALTTSDVPRILKGLAARAGIAAERISGHSCRVGMAQDLVAAGAELPAVMQAGRWKSPTMPARYAEKVLPRRGAVARFYEQRGG
ncbi:site-specific integrase [Roseomonas chloroacetimidivorans]|uniref:site-specific integrase n=1 Tax=Roseomonas chloroacetimidivorans TaxID=1766656 RepID=UPI003C709864